VSAEDIIEAAASTHVHGRTSMSRCPVSGQSGRISGRAQALRRVPAYLAAPLCNGVYVLVCGDWYECNLGPPEDVQSDCSTSQHARPVTVAMIREQAGGPARHRPRAPGRPARGRTAWRRVGSRQQPGSRRSIQGPCASNTSKKTFKPPRASRSVELASFLSSLSSRFPQRALRCWAGRRGP
jgi:hypothetical protein